MYHPDCVLIIKRKITQITGNPKQEVRKLGSKEVSKERQQMILDMVDIGVKQVDIANYCHMPKSKISNIVKAGRIEKEAETRGRNRKLSSRDTRSLLKVADKLRFKPAHKIASVHNQFSPIPVSIRTVRRTLKDNGIRNYIASSKLFLSPKNLKARLEWANIHEKWDKNEWDKNEWDRVVFSDESSFTVRPISLKKRIWRKANTKFQLRNLVYTFKSGYVPLSVSSGFCANGRTPLVRINGTLKQEKYKKIIENYVLPIGTAHYGNKSNFVFQQDNCGPTKINL